ncbi:MAG: DUF5667 domain-containing protein [Candidatus Pacebacteria bacterium]|nr:DUF5667 domain-containing protein [Candidatus Paceibacterota bacterium]MDD3919472.1 DUF5667 domain-containing protein [Candidatus Paceibacterota bacterium]
MNKKLIITLTFIITFCFIGINFTNASTNSNILPSNPFYFFKDLGRQIQDFLTFDATQKVELRLQIADEKLAEIEKIAETNPNSSNYQKYLEGYETAIEKIKEKIDSVSKEKTETIVDSITEKMIEHEERLEELKNIINSKNIVNIEETQNNIINSYTETSLKITTQDILENKIKSLLENTNEETILRIEEQAPEALKNIFNNLDLEKITEDAEKIGLTPTEIISEINTLSEEDKEKLEQYALKILTENKAPEDIITNFEELDLSTEALQKLNNLKTISEEKIEKASNYCLEKGNTITIEGMNVMCVSPQNEKCEVMSYLNESCILE